MPLLGDPGTDTTHERATTRGKPRAWYERKVDTLPGRVTSNWDAWVGTQKVNPRNRSTLQKRGLTRWKNPKLGGGAVGPSAQNKRSSQKGTWQYPRAHKEFQGKFAKVHVNSVKIRMFQGMF